MKTPSPGSLLHEKNGLVRYNVYEARKEQPALYAGELGAYTTALIVSVMVNNFSNYVDLCIIYPNGVCWTYLHRIR
jgi:hypothetical protein